MEDNRTANEERSDFVTKEAVAPIKDDISKLYDHARVANEEMGHIKEDISGMKTDLGWIKTSLIETKQALERFDNRTWVIISTIILGTLIQIALKIWK